MSWFKALNLGRLFVSCRVSDPTNMEREDWDWRPRLKIRRQDPFWTGKTVADLPFTVETRRIPRISDWFHGGIVRSVPGDQFETLCGFDLRHRRKSGCHSLELELPCFSFSVELRVPGWETCELVRELMGNNYLRIKAREDGVLRSVLPPTIEQENCNE